MAKYCMIVLTICLLAASLGARAHTGPSWLTEGLRSRLVAEAEQLAPRLVRMDANLVARLPPNLDGHEQRKMVKELLARPDLMKMGAKSESGLKKSLKKVFACTGANDCRREEQAGQEAQQRLLSLSNLVGVCQLDTLERLELLDMALLRASDLPLNILNIVHDYRNEHASACRPTYRQQHDRLVQDIQLDQQQRQDYERVHAALDQLTMIHFDLVGRFKDLFDHDHQLKQLLMMPDFAIEDQASDAVYKIVLQIGRQLFKSQGAIKEAKNTDDAQLRQLLDDHLFEPCSRFTERASDVLEPALVVSTFEDGGQIAYIAEDEQFFHNLFDYGFCKKLLAERDRLYPKFLRSWRSISPKRFATDD